MSEKRKKKMATLGSSEGTRKEKRGRGLVEVSENPYHQEKKKRGQTTFSCDP
jgi:hypothetical protein